MKKILLSTVALTLTAGAAFAADLPSRKAEPLPPPPPPMWTGFYAGLNAGYGFGTNSNTQSAAAENLVPAEYSVSQFRTLGVGVALSGVGTQNQNGFIGGGQIGYNYQYGSNIIIGLEADIQGSAVGGNNRIAGIAATSFSYLDDVTPGYLTTDSTLSNGVTSINAGVNWMGTVRGRLGYLFTPNMLVYATGGLTYGGVHANVTQFATADNSSDWSGIVAPEFTHSFMGGGTKSQTLVGWNIGGGLEWMFMPNWSLKAEGIYWNMGNMNVPTTAFAPAPARRDTDGANNPYTGAAVATAFGGTRVNYQGVIARAGVNYHFNFGGFSPVVANY